MTVLTEQWSGPFGGVPPWEAIDPNDFVGAFETAFAQGRAEIDAIATNDAPPTFENTVVALERSGAMLDRVASMFFVHVGNLNLDPIPEIQRQVSPMLAAYSDEITQNQALFDRIEAVHAGLDDDPQITADGRRLVENRYKEFVRHGARLNQADKSRLSVVNQRLAELYTDFSQNVLQDEGELATWVADSAQLDGLPAAMVAAMETAAADRGRSGEWAVLNTRSMMDPVLSSATDRALREQVWRTYYGRGDFEGERDNKPIIREILKLRAERAGLLGYETYAHWSLEGSMAKTPEQAMGLLDRVWPKARSLAIQEVADMEELAGHPIEPWDYRFYAEQVRTAHYDLDFNEVKPYLQLEKLIEAMMWCSSELYGLQYTPVAELGLDVPTFHEDVRVWQVTDADDALVGLWYLDPYAREGKSSGAWMTSYRDQANIDEPVTTLVSNNSNFVKGAPGESILISWDDARTLFHEFGHALHGLLSKVTYPSQSGTAVTRDYVEFPSQINEHWLMTDEVLQRFCRHVETDEPLPAELIARIKAAENFNQGFDTVEYLACAIIDLKLHLAGDADIDPAQFEVDALAELQMPEQIVMRHRTPQFAHIFSGDGYAAGYYSYLWADALTADAAEAFEEAGGYFDREVADRLRTYVLSAGDTVDPADGFRSFRGRDVDTDALLRKRGFPVA